MAVTPNGPDEAIPPHVQGRDRVERLLRERADIIKRLAVIDKIFENIALATNETGADGEAEADSVAPPDTRKSGSGPRSNSTPHRVRQVFDAEPDRAFRSPEIVDILSPNITGGDRKHFDMLVRGAISKFCQTDPPIVKKIAPGLYQSNRAANTSG